MGERGSGEFREIEWDEALQIATGWLAPIRERNPDELAFFTGRDQSQALTGWWAQQFGTINYAAHGGFCSVNMAAGGLYTIGGSFWEFGEPDWEHAQYLMLWGVAEDHDSNPIKLGLGKLKARGAKIVAVNPVRTGYGAIADEWIGIRPGTDGLFAFALIHELLRSDRIDLDYLVRYANAHWLVMRNPGGADDGLFARDARWQAAVLRSQRAMRARRCRTRSTSRPRWSANSPCPTAAARCRCSSCSPSATSIRSTRPMPSANAAAFPPTPSAASRANWPQPRSTASCRCRSPGPTAGAASTPRWSAGRWRCTRCAASARTATASTPAARCTCCSCCWARSMRRARSATSRRSRSRFRRRTGPARRARPTARSMPAPLGFVHGPEDLLVDADGQPRRIDHAFSWAYPLAAHGMMHTVIRNAWAGDPYRIDTLLMFMANMSWNSAMNTRETMRWLTDKDADGDYRIPRIIYSDAYASEMVAYADLVLPDTTYLERFDAI